MSLASFAGKDRMSLANPAGKDAVWWANKPMMPDSENLHQPERCASPEDANDEIREKQLKESALALEALMLKKTFEDGDQVSFLPFCPPNLFPFPSTFFFVSLHHCGITKQLLLSYRLLHTHACTPVLNVRLHCALRKSWRIHSTS